MPELLLPYQWTPRDYQLPAWTALEKGCTRVCLVWHRRAGKDLFGINWIASQIFQRVGLYWHILPTYAQGRKVVWEGMTRTGRPFLSHFPEEIIERKRHDEMKLWFPNGSQYQVVGGEDPDKLVGSNPIGVIFSEWPLMPPKVWTLLRPILAENGGWAIFIYTPRGHNHGYRTLQTAQKSERWFAQVLPVNKTGAVSEEDIQAEREEGMEEEMVQQEFYCSFEAPLVGAYYGDLLHKAFQEGRILRVPWEPNIPVNTGWDLGMNDENAIWFHQYVGREHRLIDFYQNRGQGLPFYFKRLREKPYHYGQHWVPFDANVRELIADQTRVEAARSAGFNWKVVPKLPIQEGINAVRVFLETALLDDECLGLGLQALKEYSKQKIEGETDPDGRPIYRNIPKHDWTSNPADALRTLVLGFRVPKAKAKGSLAPPVAIV